MRYQTYGLHALKAAALFCQIVIHAQAWAAQFHGAPVMEIGSLFVAKARLMIGAFSMMIPATAAAVLRMTTPTDSDGKKLIFVSWRPYLWLMIGLGLIESCKHVLVYGAGSFFEWDALHLIVVSFALILAVGRISISWLWPLCAILILGCPVLIYFLNPYEIVSLSIQNGDQVSGSPLAWAYFILGTVGFGAVLITLLRSQSIPSKNRFRTGLLLGALWIFWGVACSWIKTDFGDVLILKQLWIGMLIGTKNSQHIWGIFPWAGTCLFGFLIYDLLLKTKKPPVLLGVLFCLGLLTTLFFYGFFVEDVLQSCSPRGSFTGFGGDCFNRTPSQLFLILGLFCMAVPLATLAERFHLETRAVQAFGRSILWVYLFETTLMVYAARVFVQYIPVESLLRSFLVFSFSGAVLIALVVDRFPWHIRLTLRKETPS